MASTSHTGDTPRVTFDWDEPLAWIDWPLLLWLCAAGFVLRLAYVAMSPGDFVSAEDYQIAQNLAAGHGYQQYDWPTAIKTPVYPLFLALFVRIFGEADQWAIVVAQHTMFAVVPILIAWLGTTLGLKRLGVIAGILFLMHPSFFVYPSRLEVTNLVVPISILWSIAFVDFLKHRDSWWSAVLIGLSSGVLIMTQPITVGPVVVALGIVIVRARLWRQAIVAGAIIVITFAPWVVRNYVVLDKVVVTKSPFWWNFYGGFMPQSFLGGEREPEKIIGGVRVIGSDHSFMRRYYVIPLQTQRRIAASSTSPNGYRDGARISRCSTSRHSRPPCAVRSKDSRAGWPLLVGASKGYQRQQRQHS